MRLDEPELLVDLARDLREDVRGVGIAELIGAVDRRPRTPGECREASRDRSDVLPAAMSNGYSWIRERFADTRAVPSARAPSAVIRSASKSL